MSIVLPESANGSCGLLLSPPAGALLVLGALDPPKLLVLGAFPPCGAKLHFL